jgi:ribonuclease R
MPTRDEILAFVQDSPVPVGKREIARAFKIKGADRIALKALLKDMRLGGQLERKEGRKLGPRGQLPPVAVIEITEIDEDGELRARPAVWDGEEAPPKIYVAPDARSRAALAPGDRVLARLARKADGTYEARTIRRIAKVAQRTLGVFEVSERGGLVRPTDKRAKHDLIVRREDANGAVSGELVVVELRSAPHGRHRLGPREARVVERLGDVSDPRNLSLIAIYEHDIPVEFPPEALAEAERVARAPEGTREDLRAVPLVTIDGADARDFDDAVWAEADTNPNNPGGWRLLVAIADVAGYVRAGGALDRAAFTRGNSVYFPDRVVPMLPEVLSNGWCSLRPNEDRACMAAELWIDAGGNLLKHRFLRGLMRSSARLTYEQVQAARDGRPDEATKPLLQTVIAPLYGAFGSLLRARRERGTLDLDLIERRVLLNDDGTVMAIEPRARLDSHRLIEEFMITANIAAAKKLESLRQPCMYRIHDDPDPVKIQALREVLEGIGLKLARGQVIRPGALTAVLEKVRGTTMADTVSSLVLRAQSQAVYSPENIGHFGLALTHYAHFTSPIRRYSDLLVHRALISGLKFGDDGLPADAAGRFGEIGEHISTTERRAATAERDAVDRLTASFLADKLGEVFMGTVTGVTRFGLFICLDESGADGLLPVSSLPDDFYVHDERSHSLVGRRWGRSFRLGERLGVRLREVTPLTGGIILDLVATDTDGETQAPSKPPSGRGLPRKARLGKDGKGAEKHRRSQGGKGASRKPKAKKSGRKKR